MTPKQEGYIGRFAPSPTGPLHFGSAVAAIASFLDARANNGQWLLRIEDIDPPREQAGASRSIVDTLLALGLEWDGDVIYQSARLEFYQATLERLAGLGRLYECACTRREIGTGPYPGTCRNGISAHKTRRSLRFLVHNKTYRFNDKTYGPQSEVVAEACGDFTVRRADGLFSYHLAVVADDAEQGINNIVRGVDLITSTARQIALQEALGYPHPAYRHIPIVCDSAGNKLSKQTGARGIECEDPRDIWRQALAFLRQQDCDKLPPESLPSIVKSAIRNWQPENLQQALQTEAARSS